MVVWYNQLPETVVRNWLGHYVIACEKIGRSVRAQTNVFNKPTLSPPTALLIGYKDLLRYFVCFLPTEIDNTEVLHNNFR